MAEGMSQKDAEHLLREMGEFDAETRRSDNKFRRSHKNESETITESDNGGETSAIDRASRGTAFSREADEADAGSQRIGEDMINVLSDPSDPSGLSMEELLDIKRSPVKILLFLRSQGFTQRDIANALNVTQSAVSRVERGDCEAPEGWLDKLNLLASGVF